LPLHVVQYQANRLRRVFAMVEERNELGDRSFEIDVVFPERIIGIDEQSLGAVLSPHEFMITARPDSRLLIDSCSYEERWDLEVGQQDILLDVLRACFTFHAPDVNNHSGTKESDDGFGGDGRHCREFESGSGPGAALKQVSARANAVPDGGSERSRAATRPQTGGGLRLPGKHLLAAERSRGSYALPVAGLEPEPARR